MAVKKYLDSTGLATLWAKIKALIPTIATSSKAGIVKSGGDITVASDGTVSVNNNSHNHSASNITSGTLEVARGGTGQTSTVDATNAFINALTEGTSTPVDNDYMITQYVNGGTTKTTYYRRKMSVVWEYFKSKISSVLGLTASNYGGTADKATKDGSGNTITSTYATKSQLTDGSVTKVDTATKGSTTKPVYLNAGVPTECNAYAGGTAVTLNGSSKSGSTASFYAPTSYGSANWLLFSNGNGSSPQFRDILQYGNSGGVTFNKVYRGIALFNKKMYESGSAECDWTYSSAVVFSGATITFTKGLSTAIESGVMTLWVEKGAVIKMDEWTSSWGTYVTNTYLAQRSGLITVGCWGDPKVYTLSDLDLFVRGTLELTDSNISSWVSGTTLSLPFGTQTVIFNTTSKQTIKNVIIGRTENGYRLTIAGKWIPTSVYQDTSTGRFPRWADDHYYDHGVIPPNEDPYAHFADYIYFNGVWYSKIY